MKKVSKKYSIEVIEEEDGFSIKRENDGFSPVELLGLLEHTQLSIMEQMAKSIKPKRVVKKLITKEDKK